MEYAKKMVLVEPRQIEKWKETMTDKTLSKLDGEMYDTLHRNGAEDEKAKLYSNSLRRYLNINKPDIEKKFEWQDKPEEKKEEVTKDIDSLVLETVPKKWKTHASKLLSHLKSNPNVGWSAKGELVVNDKFIPNSNIVDVVNDLMRKRTSMSVPTGWMELSKVLKESNVPHELIGNEERWQDITSPAPTTPSVTSSGKRSETSSKTPLSKREKQISPKRKTKKPIIWEQY